MFCILIAMVTHRYTFVKIHQTVHFKWIHFFNGYILSYAYCSPIKLFQEKLVSLVKFCILYNANSNDIQFLVWFMGTCVKNNLIYTDLTERKTYSFNIITLLVLFSLSHSTISSWTLNFLKAFSFLSLIMGNSSTFHKYLWN